MSTRIRTFRNARCRVLHARAGSWHGGWTRHLAQDEARVRFRDPIALAAGDEVVAQCYGDGTVATFAGRVLEVAGSEAAIRIVGSVGFATSREAIRIAASGIHGTLTAEDGEFDLLVEDVSPEGVGGLTATVPAVGAVLGLTVRMGAEAVALRVAVMNRRLSPEHEGGCRLGLRIVELARLDAARWNRLIEAMAER